MAITVLVVDMHNDVDYRIQKRQNVVLRVTRSIGILGDLKRKVVKHRRTVGGVTRGDGTCVTG